MIHIVLYRPEKPQNTGNIMRTCVAIHATLHIIGPITFSVDNKDLKRVGMDYVDDLKMVFQDDIKRYESLIASGFSFSGNLWFDIRVVIL